MTTSCPPPSTTPGCPQLPGRLKNLTFQSISARVLSIDRCSRVLIEWQLKNTSQDLSNLKFFVYRGEGPDTLKPITTGLKGTKDKRQFIDETPRMLNLEKNYYYQVRAVEFSTDGGTELQSFISDTFTWHGSLDAIALYIVDEHLFEFEHVNGSPIAILQKMKEGEKCTSCYDKVLKRPSKSGCKECHGTGFTAGGYYEPFFGWAKFEPDPKLVQIADFGEKEIRQTDISFTNSPELSNGDIIVELKPNRFWRVGPVRRTQKNRMILLQIARLDEVNRSDIEYDLVRDIPDDIREDMVKQFEERGEQPEF